MTIGGITRSMMHPHSLMCPVLAVPARRRPLTRGYGHGRTNEEVLPLPKQGKEHACRGQVPFAKSDGARAGGSGSIERAWPVVVQAGTQRGHGWCTWTCADEAPRCVDAGGQIPQERQLRPTRRFADLSGRPRRQGDRAPGHERGRRGCRSDQGGWGVARRSGDGLTECSCIHETSAPMTRSRPKSTVITCAAPVIHSRRFSRAPREANASSALATVIRLSCRDCSMSVGL